MWTIRYFLNRLLEYFGEVFSSVECKRIMSTECDNCRQVYKTSSIDCTRMSIEILKSLEYSSKCDIYALGVIFYEMLHG